MIDLAAVIHAASTTSTTVAKSTSSGGSILDPIAKPLAALLAAIYSVIPNYGIAIIGLSIIWMLLISPLTLKSTRSMLAMQRLQPELKKLQEKHRNDKQAFAQAQMDLFREHNVSPFGSCLPMLLPLPVFFALFRVIDGLSHTVKVNGVVKYAPKYLNQNTEMYKHIVASHGKLEAFGMNLAQGALSHHSGIIAAAPYWIALLVMGATSYMQSAMMMNRNQSAASANPQMRMMKYLAPLFAVICIRFPAGVIVYYATSNICRILQQDAMYRFDPKVKALVVQEVEEVEELTHRIDEEQMNRPGYTPPRSAREALPPAGGSGKGGKAGSGGGGGAGRGSGGGSGGSGGGGSGGRSRFRDLLAQAAEQQKLVGKDGGSKDGGSNGGGGRSGRGDGDGGRGGAGDGSSSGNGSGASDANGSRTGNGSGGNGTRSGNGSGNGSGGAGAGGSKASGGNTGAGGPRGRNNNNRPSGSRTNRKRRGR